MALANIAGIGALREALDTTNSLLAQVLEELRKTNDHSLVAIHQELQASRAAPGSAAQD